MDKILLTAFLTALAGFITAALSIVKLVNEKESKTTEFRQAWTDSVRSALAELIAKINSKASTLMSSRRIFVQITKLQKDDEGATDFEKEMKKEWLDYQRKALKVSADTSNELTKEIHHAYAKVRLHFKPDDVVFSRVEQKIEFCMSKFSELLNEKDSEKWGVIKEQIHSAANEITSFSRSILKSEWETVKLGEPAYKTTKKWSIRICVFMLFLLVTIGVHAGISYVSAKEVSTATPVIQQQKNS